MQLYFNYRILTVLRKGPHSEHRALAAQQLSKVREWVLSEWSKGRSWTMWSKEGRGLANHRLLGLLNALLLSGE